jgi:hypothetical protein
MRYPYENSKSQSSVDDCIMSHSGRVELVESSRDLKKFKFLNQERSPHQREDPSPRDFSLKYLFESLFHVSCSPR